MPTINFVSKLSEGSGRETGGRCPILSREYMGEPIPPKNSLVILSRLDKNLAQRVRVDQYGAQFRVEDHEFNYDSAGVLDDITVIVLSTDFFNQR